jgi:hypothetical protein
MFRKNVLPPFSRSKSRPSNKQRALHRKLDSDLEFDMGLFYHKDGGSTFFRNVGEFLPVCESLYVKGEYSSCGQLYLLDSYPLHCLLAERVERRLPGIPEKGLKSSNFTLQLQKKQHNTTFLQ